MPSWAASYCFLAFSISVCIWLKVAVVWYATRIVFASAASPLPPAQPARATVRAVAVRRPVAIVSFFMEAPLLGWRHRVARTFYKSNGLTRQVPTHAER